MNYPNWLRLIIIGLVIAVIGSGYFLLSGRFNKTTEIVNLPSPTPITIAAVSPTPTPQTAANVVADKSSAQNTNSLPSTGFPLVVGGILATVSVVTGYKLRKYSN